MLLKISLVAVMAARPKSLCKTLQVSWRQQTSRIPSSEDKESCMQHFDIAENPTCQPLGVQCLRKYNEVIVFKCIASFMFLACGRMTAMRFLE